MEKYLFCNFMEKVMERKNPKGVVQVQVSDELDAIQLAKAYLEDGNSGKILKFVSDGEVCNGEEVDFIGTFNTEDKRVKSSYEELKHTEENPIILIATEEFKVYVGVPTYIKYVPVKDGVLLALIKGYVSVKDANGEMVPLSRNCNSFAGDSGKVFKAEDVDSLNLLEDRESGVLYSDYVVNDCIINLEASKDSGILFNRKFSKENFTVLYKGEFEKGKALKEQKREQEEERRRLKAEENARFAESMKAKQNTAPTKKTTKSSKPKTKSATKDNGESSILTGSQGAMSFLDFVEKAKKGEV